MVFRAFNGRFFAGVALSGLMLAVAGCQSGDKGVLGIGANGQPGEPDTRVKASDLLAYCPAITLRDGTAYFNTYAKGGRKMKKDEAEEGLTETADNSADVVYQAAITDVTRDCSRGGGQLTMKVAVAGKVVPGPKGSAGAITMPIRVAVVHGSQVLYSQLHQYKVQVADMSAATQFVFNDPNVVIPEPSDKNYQVFVGYDEGPPAKKKK